MQLPAKNQLSVPDEDLERNILRRESVEDLRATLPVPVVPCGELILYLSLRVVHRADR